LRFDTLAHAATRLQVHHFLIGPLDLPKLYVATKGELTYNCDYGEKS
jgi:hypothetical protein